MAGDKIELQGFEVADAKLAELLRRGEDMAPAMGEIGSYLVSSTQRRFDQEVSPAGVPWLPTWRSRVRGGKILRDTIRLLDSITYLAGDDRVEVGTNVAYAAIHQRGGEIVARNAPHLVFKAPDGGFVRKKKVTIPARPFLGLSAADGEEIESIAGEYLEGAFR